MKAEGGYWEKEDECESGEDGAQVESTERMEKEWVRDEREDGEGEKEADDERRERSSVEMRRVNAEGAPSSSLYKGE